MSNRTRIYLSISILIVYSCIIVVLTSISSEDVEQVLLFPMQDKLAHILMFGLWGFVLGIVLMVSDNFAFTLPSILGGVLFSAIDESMQYFSTGRTVEFADWTMDVLGIILGFLFFYYIMKIRGVDEYAS